MQLEEIIALIMQSEESGLPLNADQLLRDHPEHAAELTEFLRLHVQLTEARRTSSDNTTLCLDGLTPAQCSKVAITGKSPSKRSPAQPSAGIFDNWQRDDLPRVFGDYEILEEIDRGGMGVVYKARHVRLSRVVALKVIRSGELASAEEIQRFRSEAEAAAALSHPGIVPIYEVGTLNGLIYYTMAYIDGKNLAELAASGPLDPNEAARIVFKLCQAIEHAHRSGVFHRDLKPANVLVDNSGQPIIIDFGLAKIAHHDHHLTSTGQLLGTPAYMPPEHASGRARVPNAGYDVYSLGAILYFLCAGQPPFSGPTPFDVLMQVLDRAPPNPSKLSRRVSHDLDYICQHALEKQPEHRYQSASELADDLQAILRGEPLDCPRPNLMARLESWWQREPILVTHVCGIGATAVILAVSYLLRGEDSAAFPFRMFLLLAWLIACYALQIWVVRARWRDIACLTWVTIDVSIYTTLIAFADPPRSMLLIGYPMLIVANSQFYRQRFVIFTTIVCAVGFLMLGFLVPRDDFVKKDFSAIFLMGLSVIGLSMLSVIRRIRSLRAYCE